MKKSIKYGLMLWVMTPAAMAVMPVPAPDPANYKALMLIYKQMVETYNATIKSLDKMEEIRDTVQRAQNGLDAVKNYDIKESFERINTKDQKGFDKVTELRRQLKRNGGAVSDQADNFKEFQRLVTLAGATKDNAAKAAGGLNAGQSQSLTAQSTAVMAALAVDAAEEKKKRELQQDALSREVLDQLRQETKIYNAFGNGKKK